MCRGKEKKCYRKNQQYAGEYYTQDDPSFSQTVPDAIAMGNLGRQYYFPLALGRQPRGPGRVPPSPPARHVANDQLIAPYEHGRVSSGPAVPLYTPAPAAASRFPQPMLAPESIQRATQKPPLLAYYAEAVPTCRDCEGWKPRGEQPAPRKRGGESTAQNFSQTACDSSSPKS
jgi:hypothetical protein